MAIRRKRPQSNPTRLLALNSAKAKLDTIPATTVISAATKARLTAAHTNYNAKVVLLNTATSQMRAATNAKNDAKALALLWISHFFQALINAILRKAPGFLNSDKGYYGIDENSNAAPDMDTEPKLIAAGNVMVSGEDARVLAGGTANAFPTKVDAKAKLDDFTAKNATQTVKDDALDTAQEALNALNTEVDGTILKVWDEVETFYNEEPIESKRANARQWGVIYVSDETIVTTVHGTLRKTGTTDPVTDAVLLFLPTDETANGEDDGAFSIDVQFDGEGTLKITAPDVAEKNIVLTLPGVDGDLDLGVVEM